MSASAALGLMSFDDQENLPLKQSMWLLLAFLIALGAGVLTTGFAKQLPQWQHSPPFTAAVDEDDRESDNSTNPWHAPDVPSVTVKPIATSAETITLVAQNTSLGARQTNDSATKPISIPSEPAILEFSEDTNLTPQAAPAKIEKKPSKQPAESLDKLRPNFDSIFPPTFSVLPTESKAAKVPLTIQDAVFSAKTTETRTVGARPLPLADMLGLDKEIVSILAKDKSGKASPPAMSDLTPSRINESVGSQRTSVERESSVAGTRSIYSSPEKQVAKSPTKATVAKPLDVNPPKSNRAGANRSNQYVTSLPKPTSPRFEVVEATIDPVQQSTPDTNQSTPEETTPAPTETRTVASQMAPLQPSVPQEPLARITRQMSYLQPRLSKTLRFYADRPLNTKDDSAWSIMHSILGYGVNGTVAVGGKKGRRTSAVNWMCWNNPCANRRLLYLEDGYIKGIEAAGSQGHPGQFLAMLAQINLKRDYPLRVQGQVFTIEDLINSEMYTCRSDKEVTFKLIALAHYLKSDAKWRNEQGEIWDIPKMIEIELSQPVNGAACGGTHRVMAISYALRTREMRGEPVDGVYLRARSYVRDYQRYAMSLQNRDGSYSSDWFKRRSDWGDKDRQLQTTGHILEWLCYSLPRNELSDPRIVRAVEFLNHLMTRHRYHEWEVGPRGHALRALSLYYKRVYERQPLNRIASLEASDSVSPSRWIE